MCFEFEGFFLYVPSSYDHDFIVKGKRNLREMNGDMSACVRVVFGLVFSLLSYTLCSSAGHLLCPSLLPKRGATGW